MPGTAITVAAIRPPVRGAVPSNVKDLSLTYSCPKGDVYGSPLKTTDLWTVTYRAAGASTSSSVAVAKAYL